MPIRRRLSVVCTLFAAAAAAAVVVIPTAPARADVPGAMVVTIDSVTISAKGETFPFVVVTGTSWCPQPALGFIRVTVIQGDIVVGPIEDDVACQPDLVWDWTSGIATSRAFKPGPAIVHVTGLACTPPPDGEVPTECSSAEFTENVRLKYPKRP